MTVKPLRSALLLLPLTSAAMAQTEDPKTMDKILVEGERETPESQAATRLPLTLRETPQSVTVITQDQLQDQKLESLREVLDQTPGIYSYAWDTERVIFSTRGFVIDNLMYDGVPATTNFSTSSIDETVDTAVYERIEVVRGATGLMTGAGSPAASVNLVRKRADRETLGGDVSLSAGSWNDRRIEADIWTPLTRDGSVRARAVGVFQDRESYQDLYANQRKVFYGVIEADVGEDSRLSVSYSDQDNQPTSNTWGSFPLYLGDGSLADWSRNVTTAPDWSFWNRRTKAAIAEFTHEFDNGWSLRSSLNWRRFDEDLALFYVYGFPAPDTGLGLDPYAYRSRSRVTENALDVYASGPFQWLGREHQLVVGYNGSRVKNTGDEFAHGALAPVGNFFEWDGSYPEPDFDEEGYLLQDIDTRQNGLYFAGRFSLAEPATLVAGARVSRWKSDHFYLYDSPDVTFHTDHDQVIPYAGLIYDVSSNYSLFASFTEIFKPQNSRDIEGRYLNPVDGKSFEVGVKGEHLEGRLNTALTVFETRQDNVAVPAVDPVTGLPAGPLPDGTEPSMAVDGTSTRGFELEVAGVLGEQWRLSLGWSHYRIEDGEGAAIRTFTPKNLVRSFATWKPTSRLTLGGGVNWQSDSHSMVESPGGFVRLDQDPVLQLSLMARWQVNDALTVQLNGQNLLDEKYFVLDEYGNSYYGAPSNYSASLTCRF
jgi:outer membrane receptor for ferric coprogen and ferric-rhodotorulic acid